MTCFTSNYMPTRLQVSTLSLAKSKACKSSWKWPASPNIWGLHPTAPLGLPGGRLWVLTNFQSRAVE